MVPRSAKRPLGHLARMREEGAQLRGVDFRLIHAAEPVVTEVPPLSPRSGGKDLLNRGNEEHLGGFDVAFDCPRLLGPGVRPGVHGTSMRNRGASKEGGVTGDREGRSGVGP